MVEFCKAYLVVNREAFCDQRLEVIINDARFDFHIIIIIIIIIIIVIIIIISAVCCRTELEIRKECYDVIIGDLADPIEGGPCYKLYTKSFYEFTVKPRLNQGGIFVTQVPLVCLYICARERGDACVEEKE